MKLDTLDKLFTSELKDLYSAENQILKALPKMVKGASSPDLKKGFEDHLHQTEGHVSRLEKIFQELGESPQGKLCKGMKGVLEEGAEMLEEDATPEVRDAGLISAAQRVEHYEMAGYGTCVAYAHQLGNDKAAGLLNETLTEEKQTNEKLTKLAMTKVNIRAKQLAAH